MRKATINGPFSMAMLNNQRVYIITESSISSLWIYYGYNGYLINPMSIISLLILLVPSKDQYLRTDKVATRLVAYTEAWDGWNWGSPKLGWVGTERWPNSMFFLVDQGLTCTIF